MDYYASFVNLPHRLDRLNHMEKELSRIGLEAVRQRGMYLNEFPGDRTRVHRMLTRTPGAVGCHASQVAVMERALELGKTAFVMEDDLIFCSDFQKRMEYIDNWTKTHSWDVIWLGASFHVKPPYWHRKTGSQNSVDNCSASLGYDAKVTDDPRMVRTYGAFATFAYLVNYTSIEKILRLLNQHLPESIGIDWLFIKIQPELECFSFVPGCVMQMDNQSDIGQGMTIWSGFLKLNGTKENSAYVFQDKMEDFDPLTFEWGEAK